MAKSDLFSSHHLLNTAFTSSIRMIYGETNDLAKIGFKIISQSKSGKITVFKGTVLMSSGKMYFSQDVSYKSFILLHAWL